jgi:hypothetical protein
VGRTIVVALTTCCATAYAVAGFKDHQIRIQMQRISQFENDRVTVWRSVIPPGTESTLHRHDHSRIVFGIVGGDLKTVSPAGRTAVTHYETGRAYWQDPMPVDETHKDVNDTSKTIDLLVVELKQ